MATLHISVPVPLNYLSGGTAHQQGHDERTDSSASQDLAKYSTFDC